ncbi:hypothetical protein GGQ84_000114 [Desulfitispora alkaliphila]|uniref:hypothetical protein n=1 Tax=Desulfitispora alkaliphila TaxID=622674 RepID=UPI003D1AB4EC
MRRWQRTNYPVLIICAILSLLIWVPTANATGQKLLELEELVISLWPEYDKPAVLAIYSGELKNIGSEPYEGRIKLNIPNQVTQVQVVAETEAGKLYVPYEISEREDKNVISWQLSNELLPGKTHSFTLEFYCKPLGEQQEREFQFDYIASYKTEKLTWDIKSPYDSYNFVTIPELEALGTDPGGFNVYRKTKNKLDINQVETVSVQYYREKEEPSIVRATAIIDDGQSTLADSPAFRSHSSTALVMLIGFASMLSFFIFYATRTNKEEQDGEISADFSSEYRDSSIKSNEEVEAEIMGKIRKLLLEDKISEETYQLIINEIGKNRR